MYFGKYSNVFPERPACRNSYYKMYRNFIREKIFFIRMKNKFLPKEKTFSSERNQTFCPKKNRTDKYFQELR